MPRAQRIAGIGTACRILMRQGANYNLGANNSRRCRIPYHAIL